MKNTLNYTREVLAYIGVIFFFTIVGYVVVFGLVDMTKEESFIVGNLIGVAGAIAKDIYSYHFGSSTGSKEKDTHIANMKGNQMSKNDEVNG